MGKSLNPLALQRASGYREAAYEAIKEAILSGKLEYGQPLVEEDIATKLQVSRTPVREALAILQHEGLISPRNGRGFLVRALTREEFLSLFVANEVVEPYLARCAALNATEEQLRSMTDAIEFGEYCARSGDLSGILRSGRDFHRAVGIASGNSHLMHFVVSNEERADLYLMSYEKLLSTVTMSPSNQEHEMICQAIARRDPEAAARLVTYHAQSLRGRLSAFFDDDEFQKLIVARQEAAL